MKIFTILCSTLFLVGSSFAQQITSATFLGSQTKEDIGNDLGIPIFQYDVDYYKLTYESKDAKGNPDELSALLMLPKSPGATFPVLFYEHGTSSCKECVPSRFGQSGGEEGQAGLVFSAMGYVTLLPDYVGMGDGNGFQTYVHYQTSVDASDDLLTAFRAWAADNDVLINDQLFITGYSQGGYASMAFQKGMQEKYGESSVTAASHNSGPYSLSGVMRDLILLDTIYYYPAYIPNTFLGMNEVYEMYTDLNEFFKPEFISDIQAYHDGTLDLVSLNTRIIDTLELHYGASISNKMIIDSELADMTNNPNHPINLILKENDVHNWVPKSPTRIFYCKGDDQVPYMNSVVAEDTMYALGADPNLVSASNLNDNFDHAGCVKPAFMNTLQFFANYQEIVLATEDYASFDFAIYPNPANDKVKIISDYEGKATVSIWSMSGQLLNQVELNQISEEIQVSDLAEGIYMLQINYDNIQSKMVKLNVKR